MPKVKNEKGEVVWEKNTNYTENWQISNGVLIINDEYGVKAAYTLKQGDKVER